MRAASARNRRKQYHTNSKRSVHVHMFHYYSISYPGVSAYTYRARPITDSVFAVKGKTPLQAAILLLVSYLS